MDPVVLDGSEGEGGGQILRTALSLSLVTRRPFVMQRIRARRKPPGIRPQHLACIRGAEAISASKSEAADVGAAKIRFEPGEAKSGEYLLEVGTAGSTPLLLQCLFYPLALAGGGTLILRGGTHLPHSPSYHYLAAVWVPLLARYGLGLELHLKQAGFYPKGGGELRAVIGPRQDAPGTVDLPSRGTLYDVVVTSFVSGVPYGVAERQANAAEAALREKGIYCESEKLPLPSRLSKGTAVFIRATFERSVAGFTALGAKGKPAEEVGREAAKQLADFMESGGAIDEHLGDQILVPAALLAAGKLGAPGVTRFRAAAITPHLTTNAAVLEKFLGESIHIEIDKAKGSVIVAPVVPAG